MAQMHNVHNSHESFSELAGAGYTGYADFRWFLTFTVLPDPVMPGYCSVKATILLYGTTGYAHDSLTTHAPYGDIILTFPPLPEAHQGGTAGIAEEYDGKPTSIVNNVDSLHNSLHITVSPAVGPGAQPTIWLNACTIDQEWIIGARNIMIVEPALRNEEAGPGTV